MHSTALVPRSFGPAGSRSARWPSLPQRRFTHPCNPLSSPTGGPSCRGSARLACARPAVGVRSLRHAPCTHGLLLASLRGRSTAEDAGCSLPCRSASTAPHMHHAAAPQMQARPRRASTHRARQGIAPSLLGLPRPLASSPLGCSRASGGRRSARTGPSPLVPRSTGPRCAPALKLLHKAE